MAAAVRRQIAARFYLIWPARNILTNITSAVNYVNYNEHNSFQLRSCTTKHSKIGTVDFNIVKQISQDPNKFILDVRRQDEIEETGLIPGSINIPAECLTDVLGPTTNNDQFFLVFGRRKPSYCTELVFTCRSGKRAVGSATQAIAMGYTNVKVYEGSWIDWQQNSKKN